MSILLLEVAENVFIITGVWDCLYYNTGVLGSGIIAVFVSVTGYVTILNVFCIKIHRQLVLHILIVYFLHIKSKHDMNICFSVVCHIMMTRFCQTEAGMESFV